MSAVVALLLVAAASTAFAAPAPETPGTATLRAVISNAQTWLTAILFAIATLFLVLSGVYRVTAGGDPAQVDKAKDAFRNALYGYGLAVLAPTLLEVVKGIVGG